MATCLLVASIPGPSQATILRGKSPLAAVTASGPSEPNSDDGRLVVRRIPNLGNNVIVDLYIDGVPASPIVYGQTYEGQLTPGRHVLSVIASPRPVWRTRSETVLNVRKGQTYSFTAMGDGSGSLVLKGV
jgi:hypothetical protein